MSWTCEKCATMHDTDEQREQCAASERRTRRLSIMITIAIFVLVLAPVLAWNQYAYGDWKCMFMHCRRMISG